MKNHHQRKIPPYMIPQACR